MVKVYLGLGSNLGQRKKNIQKAIGRIKKIKDVKIKKSSALYETEPVGYKKQPWFINAAIEIETELPPAKLLQNLREIEKKLGRQNSHSRIRRGGPRIIDLDLLFYGKEIIRKKNLSIPHPRLSERKFVLIPLNEINPRIYHPKLKKTVHQLLNDLKNNPDQVIKISPLHKIRSGSLITQISKRLHRCSVKTNQDSRSSNRCNRIL